jgi:hypothetical protein
MKLILIHNCIATRTVEEWMRAMRIQLLVLTFCVVSLSTSAQQFSPPTAANGPQTASVIQQSLMALTRGLPVTDVTVTGAYAVTSASATESGTITMVATASGQGRSTVAMPSGTYSETRSISAGSASMIETGPDGVPHAITTQTAISPNPAWFYPALVLAAASSPFYASSYLGQETLNGEVVLHLAVWWQPGSDSSTTSATLMQFWQQATRHDIYLDASSLLPVSMTFLLHPYDPENPGKPLMTYRGSNSDRTVELLFSDYQVVQGRPVAFHIHSTLKTAVKEVISDIQLSSVTFNTGVIIDIPSAAN